MDIIQNTLSLHGLKLPPMGIGTMTWGEKRLGYGKSFNLKDIFQAYQTLLDMGFNYFDTAELYGNGESERILGECKRRDGRPVIISTKFMPTTRFIPFRSSSPQLLLEGLERSLQRLEVEQIDLFQLHAPPALSNLDAYLDVMAEAVRRGKVKAVGVCNFNSQFIQKAYHRLTYHGISLASTMVGYNLLRRYPETNGVMQACRELNIAFIAYAPFAEGILTGKYRNRQKSVSGMNRLLFFLEQLNLFGERNDSVPLLKRMFSKPRVLDFKRLEPLFVALADVAKTHEKTIAQVVLNWIKSSNPCIIPIPGVKNVRQAKENAGAIGWKLTNEEFRKINEVEIATR